MLEVCNVFVVLCVYAEGRGFNYWNRQFSKLKVEDCCLSLLSLFQYIDCNVGKLEKVAGSSHGINVLKIAFTEKFVHKF